MTDPTSAEEVLAHAVVDVDGVLLSADPMLDDLNARAGGAVGAPLALPQVARVARLAASLGVPVSRKVLVANEAADLTLWLNAQPGGDRVRLSASGWRDSPAWRSEAPPSPLPADADWRWQVDAALRLSFLSRDAATGAGADVFASLGQPLGVLFAFDDDASGASPIAGALAGRRGFGDQPARMRATGQRVMLSAAVQRDQRGHFAGLIGSARVVEAAPEPETASSSLPVGLDTALRQPLARIIANAESMHAATDGPIAAGYADYAADIAGAGRHLLELVEDLVDLQAIERPGFVLATEAVDLADVARRAAGLLAVRSTQAGVTIERPPGDAACPASGDFRRTLQIVVNLITNALRYSPTGGTVRVTANRSGRRASLTVADDGKGVAPKDQARIFEKFERVDPSEAGGSGLGLYIARRLARAMGGDLTVESETGEGARFTLSLAA